MFIDTWTYVYKDNTGFWLEGIKKRKLEKWMELVPNDFHGFAEIREDEIVLYNKDWNIRKKIKKHS